MIFVIHIWISALIIPDRKKYSAMLGYLAIRLLVTGFWCLLLPIFADVFGFIFIVKQFWFLFLTILQTFWGLFSTLNRFGSCFYPFLQTFLGLFSRWRKLTVPCHPPPGDWSSSGRRQQHLPAPSIS